MSAQWLLEEHDTLGFSEPEREVHGMATGVLQARVGGEFQAAIVQCPTLSLRYECSRNTSLPRMRRNKNALEECHG